MKNENPWLGLGSYKEGDRIFGREKEIAELSAFILNSRHVILYGKTGVGKSSLLRAGIFPVLRYEDYFPICIRLEHNSSTTYARQIKEKLLASSSDSLKKSLEKIDSRKDAQDTLSGILRPHIDESVRCHQYPLLVLDQFEEMFTLPDAKHKKYIDEFFYQLAELLDETNEHFKLVICLREDYLYCLEKYSTIVPALKRNRCSISAMSVSQALDVINKPVKKLVDQKAANTIVSKLISSRTSEIEPLFLSLFMFALYNRMVSLGLQSITANLVQDYSGDFISDFYQSGTRRISPSTIEYLEDHLVTDDDYRCNILKKTALSSGVSEDELNHLTENSIIHVFPGTEARDCIEYSHDKLVEVVVKNRDERRLRNQVRKAKRQLYSFVLVFIIVLAIIISFTWQNIELGKRKDKILTMQSIAVTFQAEKLLNEGDYQKAAALCIKALPKDISRPDRPFVSAPFNLLSRLFYGNYFSQAVSFVRSSGYIFSASYSPDGRHIVTASEDKTAIIWDAETGENVRTLKGHSKTVISASYSPDGRHIVTASGDKTAIIWDAETGEKVDTLEGHTKYVNFASYSPDGRYIVTASGDKTAVIWDAATGENVRTLNGHANDVESASYSPDGRYIVTASEDKTAIIWDASTGEKISTLGRCFSWVNSASFSPDGKNVVITSKNTAIIFRPTEKKELSLKGHSVSYSPDGRHIVTASEDNAAIIWDAETGEKVDSLKGHFYIVRSASYSPGGLNIVTVSRNKTAIIWDAATGEKVRTLKGHSDRVESASYSPDGRYIVTASTDYTAIIWVAATGDNVRTLKGHTDDVNSASYSPNGRYIVTASDDKTAIIWDASTGEKVRTLKDHTRYVNSASYSPDGQYIVTASNDDTAIIWDAETGEKVRTLKGHTESVNSASYSPDGQYIVTASNDDTAIIWDAETGENLYTLGERHFSLYSALYSPDGRNIVTVSSDNHVRCYRILDCQELIDRFRMIVGIGDYQFTEEEENQFYLK